MNRWLLAGAALPLAVLLLPGCREAPSEEHVVDDPVTIEQVDGSEVARITLTERAVERLGLETTLVRKDGEGRVIPNGAVIVDPQGVFWVYTSPEPLVFVREEVELDDQAGGMAHISAGPRAGTEVVTVGVPELYGAETGIGH